MKRIACAFLLSILSLISSAADAPRPGTNQDESKVPPYTLPEMLVCKDGTKVDTAKLWTEKRRPELLDIFQSQMYGRAPEKPADMSFEVISTDAKALGGIATRKEVGIHLGKNADAPVIHVLVYIPNDAPKPVPLFIGVNFDGNHTIDPDPGIPIREEWNVNKQTKREEFAKPSVERGKSIGRWDVATSIKRGYAVATIARNEIEPDYTEGWKHGIRGYFLKQSGKAEFAADDWGAIRAWGWATSRALDYFETDPAIDAKKVITVGHSRMGKASLAAGAFDERFAIVISNDSGEGGAALARRFFGETTAVMNKSFPHWFCGNFKQYSGNEAAMPTDQHELLALIAPRPLYVASAEEDKWADPLGEFLSAKHAGAVYKLFGKAGVGVEEFPAVNTPVGDVVRYHMRTGKHDITAYDWEQYLNFADKHLKGK